MTKIIFEIGQKDSATFYGFSPESIPDLRDIVEEDLYSRNVDDNIIAIKVEKL